MVYYRKVKFSKFKQISQNNTSDKWKSEEDSPLSSYKDWSLSVITSLWDGLGFKALCLFFPFYTSFLSSDLY